MHFTLWIIWVSNIVLQIQKNHTPYRTVPIWNAVVLFMSQGVGTVVSGTTLRGLIRLNDTMLLGPDPLGSFIPIAVKSIHRKRMPVKEVRGGQTASFALKKVGGKKISHRSLELFLCVCHDEFINWLTCWLWLFHLFLPPFLSHSTDIIHPILRNDPEKM